MSNLLKRLPESMGRLLIVVIIFTGGILLIRSIIPPSLKSTELQMASAIKREASRKIKYVGSVICVDCHDEEYDVSKNGYHKNLSCETCHGPAKKHTKTEETADIDTPRGRNFCPFCHTYNSSRPMGFPQINPVIHNPLKPCIECHNAHDPKPPKTPQECMACHGEIERTKAVSSHALLKCTVCHITPDKHKVAPWSVKATKPTDREFCGKCHNEDSDVEKTPREGEKAPKVNLSTHEGKYLCWECHYPHMPEV